MRAGDVAKRVYEWIFRRGELRAARAGLPAANDAREVARRQAKLLLEVARRTAEPAEALPPGAQAAVLLSLYRDAIYWALAARRTGGGPPPSDLRALWDASNPQTISAPAPDNEASAALRRTLFDDYDPRALAVSDEDAARARSFAEALAWDLEAPRRRVAWLLTQRWLRVALIAAAVCLLVVGVRARLQGPDLAAGRPFRISAPWTGWAACVANEDCGHLMFHTDVDNEPWVEIDLGAPKSVHRVDVANRGKCCADRALPLAVELGTDQKTWTQVARRDEAFATWTAEFRPRIARYVRLKALRRTILHLKSITVR